MPIDAATARQLCCDAGISRLVSGPAGEPIDIGRTSRSIHVGLAKLLLIDDRHCRCPGCTAPAWGCEGHHVIWWGAPHDGETNRDNVALLCWHHHLSRRPHPPFTVARQAPNPHASIPSPARRRRSRATGDDVNEPIEPIER